MVISCGFTLWVFPLSACNCTAVGATGECDPATGQCVCHPNVLGFLCEGPCADFTFNYSSGLGCEPCDCHPEGASGSACNMVHKYL